MMIESAAQDAVATMKSFRENDRITAYTKDELSGLGFYEIEKQGEIGNSVDFFCNGHPNVIYRFSHKGEDYFFNFTRNVPKRDDPRKQTRGKYVHQTLQAEAR
jgi:hypothetical protein